MNSSLRPRRRYGAIVGLLIIATMVLKCARVNAQVSSPSHDAAKVGTIYSVKQEGQTGLPQLTHDNIYRFNITNACSAATVLVESVVPVASSAGEVRLHYGNQSVVLGKWARDGFPADGWLRFDATEYIANPGQYAVEIAYTGGEHGLHTRSVVIETRPPGPGASRRDAVRPATFGQGRNNQPTSAGASISVGQQTTNCTLYWSCTDVADVYINGVPIIDYSKDFMSRATECDRVFTASRVIKKGDKITVGAKRGGVCGFTMVIKDASGKTILTTDSKTWRAYEPKDKAKWFMPGNIVKSMKKPSVQGEPWPPQRAIMVNHDVKAQSIWDEGKNTVYLTATVD